MRTESYRYPSPTERQTPAVFSAKGRMGRLRFILCTHAAALILCVLLGLLAAWSGGLGRLLSSMTVLIQHAMHPAYFKHGFGGSSLPVTGLLMWALLLAFTVYFFMKVVQRSHDMGWSGWTAVFTLLPLAVLLWFIVPGTPRPNAHGPCPVPDGPVLKVLGGVFLALSITSLSLTALVALVVSHMGPGPFH